MNRLSSLKYLFFVALFSMAAGICSAFPAMKSPFTLNEIADVLPQKKKTKIKKPVSAEKAQKQAEAKDRQRKKESEQYIKESRKRSIEIQTPEVQERMKQNIKDANAKYKAQKKNNTSRTKKAGRKYR